MKTICCVLFFLSFSAQAQIKPLPNAHAHNDYMQKRPLYDALENGFISLEADVHLINNQLYVSHDQPRELSDSLLLKNLYLKPLNEWITANGGNVYPGYNDPVFLMIDIKTDANSTYERLREELQPYHSVLCKILEMKDCPVKIFISGNRPFNEILGERQGYLALDGRPEDLGKQIPSELMPVVSENYNKIHSKNLTEKESVLSFVRKAHLEGKKVRLWGAPDDELTWNFLMENGIDLINTDKLYEFSRFMKSKREF